MSPRTACSVELDIRSLSASSAISYPSKAWTCTSRPPSTDRRTKKPPSTQAWRRSGRPMIVRFERAVGRDGRELGRFDPDPGRFAGATSYLPPQYLPLRYLPLLPAWEHPKPFAKADNAEADTAG